MSKVKSQSGFSLVEAVVVAAIASGFIVVLSFINSNYLTIAFGQSEIIRANYLGEESLEAVKFLRDTSWQAKILPLVSGQNYYLSFEDGAWRISTTVTSTPPFYRTLRFDNVYRDSGDNIASSGTLDLGTKLVTATVSWATNGATTTKTLQTYITDVFSN